MHKFLVVIIALSISMVPVSAVAQMWEGGYDSLERQHDYWSKYSNEDVLLEFTKIRHGVRTGPTIYNYSSGNLHVEQSFRENVLQGPSLSI